MRACCWKAGAIGAGDLGFGCARRTKLTGGVHGSAAAGACGCCGGRRRQVGPGASVARARQVRLCGRCGLVERRASGPARDGPCGAGPSRRWWAERESGAVGPGWARGKRKREGRWAGERLGRAGKLGLGLLWVFPFLFLFLFYFPLKLNYLNSKEILNSNPYEIKQLKQCISMNALTKLNLRKFFNYL